MVHSSAPRTTDSNVEILSAFLASDKDSDGLLDQEEFASLIAELESLEITSQNQQIWFSEIDANNDGFINFEEFSTWWCRLQENRSSYQ